MLDDRRPNRPVVMVEEPTGHVEEMDVSLDGHEMKAAPGYILEPWVRVAQRDDLTLSAGISVSKQDDGA